jgi:hypothetical protein
MKAEAGPAMDGGRWDMKFVKSMYKPAIDLGFSYSSIIMGFLDGRGIEVLSELVRDWMESLVGGSSRRDMTH